MNQHQYSCKQTLQKLDDYCRTGTKTISDQSLIDHLKDCPECLTEAAKSFNMENLLSGILASSKNSFDKSNLETTPLQFIRTRVEARADEPRFDEQSASVSQPIRNPIMSAIFNQLKTRSRLSVGIALATTALLAVTVVPFKYDSEIGYEVAFAGVNKDLALDGTKIKLLLHELGVEGAKVDVSGCEATCNLKITDLKTLNDGKMLIQAFESAGAVHLTNELTPVYETVSGNLLTKVHDKILYEFSFSEKDDELTKVELHDVILQRLGDGHAGIIAKSFGFNLADTARNFESVGDDGDVAIVLNLNKANPDPLAAVPGNSFFLVNKAEEENMTCVGIGIEACNLAVKGLFDFDFTTGSLTKEQVAQLNAKGFSVSIFDKPNGDSKVILFKSNETGDNAGYLYESLEDDQNLTKETFDDDLTDPTALPQGFKLSQNYPNPFNPTTKIDYTLAAPEKVQIDIINIMGQVVTTLVDQNVSAGTHTVEWDATDDSGQKVASGMYFYRFKAGKLTQTKKMTLLK